MLRDSIEMMKFVHHLQVENLEQMGSWHMENSRYVPVSGARAVHSLLADLDVCPTAKG